MIDIGCRECDNVREYLRDRIPTSRFGRLAKQCSGCKTLWSIDKGTDDAYIIDEDVRISRPRNKQAFINDPRRRRPQ